MKYSRHKKKIFVILVLCLFAILFVVEAQISKLSPLDKKIGQLFIVGTSRGYRDDISDIEKFNLSGILLHGDDFKDGNSLQQLTQKLKSSSEDPLIVAVDEEGGNVSRLKSVKGFEEKKSAYSMGQASFESTLGISKKVAQELIRYGINFNFAPVVDLAIESENDVIVGLERSFGQDPEKVIGHAKSFIRGHREIGVGTSLKHFPGHGNTKKDSHLGFVDMTETWSKKELIPFKRLVSSEQIDSVMIGHLFHKDLDSEYPASLSKKIISGLLREKMGFEGVVVVDDIQMGALSKKYKIKDVLRLTINAGADLIIVGQRLNLYAPSFLHKTIKDLVISGEIPKRRIEESYQRIKKMKSRLKRK